jgi:hypothetical protein
METRVAIWHAMEMRRRCVVGRIDWICIAILDKNYEEGGTSVWCINACEVSVEEGCAI